MPWFSGFCNPLIYFPTDAPAPYPAIAFMVGRGDVYMESPELLTQWGKLLASHGIAMLFVDTRDVRILAGKRADILFRQVDVLAAENGRPGSPLFAKLDMQHIGVMGHSFGGTAALSAVDSRRDPRIKAAIALNPVVEEQVYAGDRTPSLIITGDGDPYVRDGLAAFNNIPASTTRAVAVFAQTRDVTLASMHLIGHSPLGSHVNDAAIARLGVAFAKVYLAGDTRYAPMLRRTDGMRAFQYAPANP